MDQIVIGSWNNSTTNEEEDVDMAVCVPVSTFTTDGNNHRIDSRLSTWNGNETGASMGVHSYIFSGNKNKLDILGGSDSLTLLAGQNVSANGDGFEKDVSGNSWDSYFYSEESFDPAVQDFAVSWLIESTTGTIREMVGLDNNPTANSSYSSIDYAAYQVNGLFYYIVYENGKSTQTGKGNITLTVGDRIGIKCESGVVTYYIQSGSTITDVYTSSNKATSPLYLKAALNRGDGSSGESVVTGCKSHTNLLEVNTSARISGLATEMISDSDINNLSEMGIIPAANTIYSDFNFQRPVSTKFPSGLDVSYSHFYSVNEFQDVKTITL